MAECGKEPLSRANTGPEENFAHFNTSSVRAHWPQEDTDESSRIQH